MGVGGGGGKLCLTARDINFSAYRLYLIILSSSMCICLAPCVGLTRQTPSGSVSGILSCFSSFCYVKDVSNEFKQIIRAAGLRAYTLNMLECQIQLDQRRRIDLNDPVLYVGFMKTFYLSSFTFHLGFVHPLQDVALALHQCLPLYEDLIIYNHSELTSIRKCSVLKFQETFCCLLI